MPDRPVPTVTDFLQKFGIPLATMLASVAMGYGGASAKVSSNSASIDKLWGGQREIRAELGQTRIEAAETRQWRVDRERWESRMEDKIDRLLERGPSR